MRRSKKIEPLDESKKEVSHKARNDDQSVRNYEREKERKEDNNNLTV